MYMNYMHICEGFACVNSYQTYKNLFSFSLLDMLNKCKGDLLEVKDNRFKTQPSLLENLVYFVEVKTLTYSSALVLARF